MGLFDFVSGWKEKLIDRPLDAKMRQAMDRGVETMRSQAHVITGYNKSTIGGTYDQRGKVVQFHIDSGYGLYEAGRGGTHDFINPGLQAAAKVWGGNFEIHFPNATVGKHSQGLARLRQQEGRVYHALGGGRGGLARRVQIHSRRWHRRLDAIPADPTTPTL